MNFKALKKVLAALIAFFVIFGIPFVLSVGSGGGGGSGGGSAGASSPSCTQDLWKCSDWGECQKNGKKTRTCTVLNDCQTVVDPNPTTEVSCTYFSKIVSSLQCFNLETLKERVECRLGLQKTELKKEIEIAYLPEECRALKKEGEKEDCVLLYSGSQKCWEYPEGTNRANCLREILDLKDIVQEKKSCGNDNACLLSLKKKVFSHIKFRFYDLEERVEKLMEEGAIDLQKAAELVSFLEEKKVEFNNATQKQQRKKIILDIKEKWENFAKEQGVDKK